MSQHVTRFPAGFDYDFRPASYFSGLDPKTLIVASILGEERRRDVEQRLKEGDFDPAVWGEWLTDPKLDDDLRKLTGSMHPSFMGGEYLPVLAENEIEIARIVLASVMQDVTSVRARRRGSRIHYSVHDEYQTEFVLSRRTSTRPLSLRELIAFIDTSNHPEESAIGGLAWSHIHFHVDNGYLDDAREFVRVESSFYPKLGSYYDRAIGEFFDEIDANTRAEDAADDDGTNGTELSEKEPKTGKSGGRR